ncbi:hypothetical protein L6452_38612 [Arctium lappa]|uniref:Uncharacterized protein n=1 Tax=Arctium lappa TaxID=4217 RepID=A0ACB8XQ12_ARCLA|nr:hypothetical protein L6452_38612 [Arctium lappa]
MASPSSVRLMTGGGSGTVVNLMIEIEDEVVDKEAKRKDGNGGTTAQKADRPSLVLNSVLTSFKAINKPDHGTFTQTSNRFDILSDDPVEA